MKVAGTLEPTHSSNPRAPQWRGTILVGTIPYRVAIWEKQHGKLGAVLEPIETAAQAVEARRPAAEAAHKALPTADPPF